MAKYAAIATGNWSSTSTWGTCGYTSTFHASSASSDITTSNTVISDTFTAPNTTDQALGFMFWPTSWTQNDTTYTITLQEYNGATWVNKNTGTLTLTGTGSAIQWVRAMLTTPYTYTTTTANYYRYTIVRDSGSGGLFRVRLRSAGTLMGIIAIDSRTAEPVDGDTTYIVGSDINAYDLTVTVDGTRAIGAAGGTTASATDPTVSDQAIFLSANANLTWDTTQSSQLTVKGMFVGNYGRIRIGSTATPYPSSYTGKLIFDQNGTTANYGMYSQGFDIVMNGVAPTNYAANYVSGSGTAASPMITSGDIGVVGDEVVIATTNNYNQTEYKFIKTKNSATSYVLADTVGGAESALAYTHTTSAKICNIQRNVIVTTTNTSYAWYFYLASSLSVNAHTYKNVRFEYMGNSAVGKFGITVGYSGNQATANLTDFTGNVIYANVYNGIYLQSVKVNTNSYNDNIFCKAPGLINAAAVNFVNVANKHMARWYFLDQGFGGIALNSVFNCEADDFYFAGNNITNSANSAAILCGTASGNVTFNSPTIQGSRNAGFKATASTTKFLFNTPLFGTVYTNVEDFQMSSSTTQDVYFISGQFASASLLSNYENINVGSNIGYHRLQNTDRNHYTYRPEGVFRSAGSGLSDTISDTTFDADSLSCRFQPITADAPLTLDLLFPQRAGNQIVFTGKLYYTAAYNGTATVELYLDGSTTPDDSYTLSGGNSVWHSFTLSADYTAGTIDRNARVLVKADGTAGYVYFDTLYNAIKTSNPIGSLDLWQDGLPNRYIVSTIASGSEIAQAVWDYLTANATTTDSMGEAVLNISGASTPSDYINTSNGDVLTPL